MATAASRRDLIVIGTSAGGVDAVSTLLSGLPADLAASVLVVQHQLAGAIPYLVDILRRRSALPVAWAEEGAAVVPGHVYVAPPDSHLVLADGHLRLDGGARENYSRPSIDRTFRSAAELYGPRTIGVVLTGMLDDGARGLAAIRAAGGRAVVQDPTTAAFPELPTNALRIAGADRTLPLAAIPVALAELVTEAAPEAPAGWRARRAAALAVPVADPNLDFEAGLLCPECGGPMRLVGDPHARRYRCALGHTSDATHILVRAADDIESAMWTAVRALHDRARALLVLARDADHAGDPATAATYDRGARDAELAVTRARQLALDVVDRARRDR